MTQTPQTSALFNFGAPPSIIPQGMKSSSRTVAALGRPLWAISLYPKLPCDVAAVSVPVPYTNSPFTRPYHVKEYPFLHGINPLGQMHGWIRDYPDVMPSSIVHICDDDWHIGTLDMSQMLGVTDRIGQLTIADIICFVGHFMGGDLNWETYQTLDDSVKRCVSLAYKRRILGATAEDDTHSKDWEDFLQRVGGVTRPPRNSDLFLGRRIAWKFTIWADYSVLWVSEEHSFAPES